MRVRLSSFWVFSKKWRENGDKVSKTKKRERRYSAFILVHWSWRWDLNQQPADYKSEKSTFTGYPHISLTFHYVAAKMPSLCFTYFDGISLKKWGQNGDRILNPKMAGEAG